MLNRVETTIMDHLFQRCRGKRTVLIPPQEVLDSISKTRSPKFEITKKQLENHMKNLVLDGYIDYQRSDDKGNLVYVVTLTTRGEAFQREREERIRGRWRSFGWKVLLTIVACVITSIFWLIRG